MTRALFARALQVTPGGVHSPVRSFKSVGGTPVFFASGSGGTLTDVEGRRFVDLCQSFGPLILGHRDPEVSEAVERAVGRAWSFGASEPYSLELAEWITSRIPWVEKIRFVSSGTEAVMSALRVARAATGRRRILKFEGCYHGHADSLLVKAGSGLAGPAASSSAGVSEAVASETLVAPLDDERLFEETLGRYGKEIAAVILEPLPANFGLLPQRREFLASVARAARLQGALFIFDEVISGFRVARGGMAEILDIRPDLVCYGKVIGGGFPVGAYGGRAALMDLVAPAGPVYQAGTLSANPVGMQAGLATLQKIERIDAYALLEKKAAAFTTELARRLAGHVAPLQVTRFGSLFWIHVRGEEEPIRRVDRIPADQAEVFARIFHGALDRGVYLPPSGYEVGFLGTAHDDTLLERAIDAIDYAAREAHAPR